MYTPALVFQCGLLGLLLSACDPSGVRSPGTTRMVARLEQIANDVDPNRNSFANSARAAVLARRRPPPDPLARTRLEIHLAQELLFLPDLT